MVDRETIDRIPALRSLNDAAKRELQSRGVIRGYAKQAILWRVGDRAVGVGCVVSGRVRILQALAGRQYVVHGAEAGAIVGDVPLFDGGGYPATAVAATRVRLLMLYEEAIRAAMRADPQLAWNLLAGLSSRIRQLIARMGRNTLDSVRQRVAAGLLAVAAETPSPEIILPFTQREWAEEIGTVREVLARELRWLERQGAIERTGRGAMRLSDEEALEAIAQGEPGRR